jgi:hypothetical protein
MTTPHDIDDDKLRRAAGEVLNPDKEWKHSNTCTGYPEEQPDGTIRTIAVCSTCHKEWSEKADCIPWDTREYPLIVADLLKLVTPTQLRPMVAQLYAAYSGEPVELPPGYSFLAGLRYEWFLYLPVTQPDGSRRQAEILVGILKVQVPND